MAYRADYVHALNPQRELKLRTSLEEHRFHCESVLYFEVKPEYTIPFICRFYF